MLICAGPPGHARAMTVPVCQPQTENQVITGSEEQELTVIEWHIAISM